MSMLVIKFVSPLFDMMTLKNPSIIYGIKNKTKSLKAKAQEFHLKSKNLLKEAKNQTKENE